MVYYLSALLSPPVASLPEGGCRRPRPFGWGGQGGYGGSHSPCCSREAVTTTRRNLYWDLTTNENKENMSPSSGGRGYVTIGVMLFNVQ